MESENKLSPERPGAFAELDQAAPARNGMLAAVRGTLLTVIPWGVLPVQQSAPSGCVSGW